MKAAEALAGKWYRTRTGKGVYIYPISKAPKACGKTKEGYRPYMAKINDRNGDRFFHGQLPNDYLLFDLS